MNEGKPTESSRPRWWSRFRPGLDRAESSSPAPRAGETIRHENAEATPGSAALYAGPVPPGPHPCAGPVPPTVPAQAGGPQPHGSPLDALPATGAGTTAQPGPAPADPAAAGPPPGGPVPADLAAAVPSPSGPVPEAVGSPPPNGPVPDAVGSPPPNGPVPDAVGSPPPSGPVPVAPGAAVPPLSGPVPADLAAAGPPPGGPVPADLAAAVPSPTGPVPEAVGSPPPNGPVPDAVGSPLPSGPVPADPGAGSPASSGPWSRYDPWAAAPLRVPLQQHAAGVPAPRRRRRRALLGGALALALVSGGAGGFVGAYVERNGGVGAVRLPQAGKEPAGRAPDSVAGIAARALPGVVTLHVAGSDEQGTGTGFVLDRLGHVLTNNHVVEPAASGGEISVTFSGGQTARASIVGRDSGYDLAVVQVHGVRGLTPVPLGNSDNVRVGDPVVAIGAPFDLANTVTSGIISAKERPITAGGEKGDGTDVSYVDALQTDAPINPGNSGGPLLDARGRVVGVNSAIRSAGSGADVQDGQAGSIGLGFAIPVNQARRVAEELINTGRATHPVIGVTLDMAYTGDGARVAAGSRGGGAPVTPRGPGAEAGIRAGDVITAVDGRPVHTGEELIVRTRAHRPGDRLELTVERDGRRRTLSLVLGSSGGD
ncbi:trypsin-like peptidase domain-containing protein [Streptomyces sp. NPDC046831]|uniref:S1C family serine protease n=1 Tax=Streptomyces sp. NPDC046831 TaxID=3154805 RepID=UPI0033CA8FD0